LYNKKRVKQTPIGYFTELTVFQCKVQAYLYNRLAPCTDLKKIRISNTCMIQKLVVILNPKREAVNERHLQDTDGQIIVTKSLPVMRQNIGIHY
jgi:hypothetical protein